MLGRMVCKRVPMVPATSPEPYLMSMAVSVSWKDVDDPELYALVIEEHPVVH